MKILFFLFFVFFSSYSQTINFEKIGEKDAKYDLFWGNDISDNFYFSTNNNLYKIYATDTISYTNNKFGKITGVETFNMLQTLVFYKENNAFVLVDAQFNEINATIFSEINCDFLKPASQNELWFFDNLTQQIGLYNLNSQKFNFLSNPFSQTIKYVQSDYNFLYWIDIENQMYSVNKFGKISSLGKLPVFEKVFFSDKMHLFFLIKNQIFHYTAENQTLTNCNISENLIKNFFYKDGILSIFTNFQLHTYQLKK